MKSASPEPPLSDAVVRDDQRLAAAIDALLVPDERMRRRRAAILRRQRALRSASDERAWQAYLRLEEASNARLDAALILVAKWAFREGRRRMTAPLRIARQYRAWAPVRAAEHRSV